MLYYVTFGTNDLAKARAFYAPTLATLGLAAIQDTKSETGYGRPGDADPSLYVTIPYDNQPATHGNGTMLALTAPDPGRGAGLPRRSPRPRWHR